MGGDEGERGAEEVNGRWTERTSLYSGWDASQMRPKRAGYVSRAIPMLCAKASDPLLSHRPPLAPSSALPPRPGMHSVPMNRSSGRPVVKCVADGSGETHLQAGADALVAGVFRPIGLHPQTCAEHTSGRITRAELSRLKEHHQDNDQRTTVCSRQPLLLDFLPSISLLRPFSPL
ncbi:hypothetical protein PYCCODRAFT_1104338 [Trametes coccinea BRFM310]|uniref:Uncharacterized protein n=1 Tax=Trametes coccinea (strain BRFM310) TaxID=1353009 RepID=A0A1Y2IBJ3_TRAC3|nr:hypothetical protein PYCCODRAFT_1104338 [Trametes coccinea BRFM310]